ncbi:TetR/AcrR family transcriptional regulator [Amycolatopsis taiwanensis]|nr:TetR/AcrR family transcriptional regulator C-terminal domain-containing protein [Amycolatopsis taiwanensis]
MFVTIVFVSEHRVVRSRRERPSKPALARDRVVAAAVAVMRSEGLEKVTLRRLATELDTGPASLYVYFRNVADLHAAVLDELLASVDLGPVGAPGDWRERLEAVLSSYVGVLMQYPPLARSALLTRPSGPCYLDLVEALVTLLREGGVEADRAAWAVDLLMQVATATGAEQATRRENPRDGDEWDVLVAAIENADVGRYPQIRDLGQLLLSGTGTTRMRWALSVLLNGILATALPVPAPASPSEINTSEGERS